MSSAGLVFVLFLFVSPFCDAFHLKDGATRRQRRSLTNLNAMVESVTGRPGSDFIGYGNWCGLGGSGNPVDPIDECCQIHDLCYNLATRQPCKDKGKKSVYNLDYIWRTDEDGTATCDDNSEKCKNAICMCDAVLTNCLKENLEFYDEDKLANLNIMDLIKEAQWISNP